jgi:tetratricopeptide (TPR) repeat protein
MRPVSFPLTLDPGVPGRGDYLVHASSLKQLFRRLIPTSTEVIFLSQKEFDEYEINCRDDEKRRIYQRVCTNHQPQKIGSTAILFLLGESGDDNLVALVSGIDPVVVERASDEWLSDSSKALDQEFAQIKKYGTDPVSLLYNAFLFRDVLSTIECANDFHVVLVELLPRARSPKDAFGHVIQSSRALKEYNRFSFPLFHIGHSLFAFIIPDRDRQFLKSFCLSLITFMKTKLARRVHCGCSSLNIERSSGRVSSTDRQRIVDEAWHALHTACRRGPFAFCDYDILANPEHFPLRPPSQSLLGRLQRRWRDHKTYSLIYFKPDFEKRERLDDNFLNCFKKEIFVVAQDGYIVLRPGLDGGKAKQWAIDRIEHLKKLYGDGFSFSAGVSSYPFRDYTKPQIVRNCQKALLHGDFFGPGSCVVFDALSLNISGDIYFGEGDLRGAVREYRLGIDLAEFDSNLLNSLGVTYALMNRTTEALKSFDRVLAHSPGNFMALYNKGLIEQSTGKYDSAILSFSNALEVYDRNDPEESGAIGDLNYQLGVALFYCNRYQECSRQLQSWYEEQPDRRAAGKCCRFIGISCYNLNVVAEASKWLQRGLSFDEFDAESLSLLGELYLREREGDEIALRLAEKSVEIDSSNKLFLLRYGRALAACRLDDEAIDCLKRCVRWEKSRYQAWCELMTIYARQNNAPKARLYAKKLLGNNNVPDTLLQRARLLKNE